MARWIDLNDASGARLRLASIEVGGHLVNHVFITNLAHTNPKWAQTMRVLGFREPPSRRYLVRRMEDGEHKLSLAQIRRVFPQARIAEMEPAQYMLETASRSRAAQTVSSSQVRADLNAARRLGRNAQGNVVYEGPSARFEIEDTSGRRVDEFEVGHGVSAARFLRLSKPGQDLPQGLELHAALLEIGAGLVASLRHGEPLHTESLHLLAQAAWPAPAQDEAELQQRVQMLYDALDEALLLDLMDGCDSAASAYSQAARLQDYRPDYVAQSRGVAALPTPLAMAAQRLLGDLSDKTLVVPNVWDGALASFVSPSARVLAFQHQQAGGWQRQMGSQVLHRRGIEWQERAFSPSACHAAHALLFNADPQRDVFGRRQDYDLAQASLRHLSAGARAVLLLAGDDGAHPARWSQESLEFFEHLAAQYILEDAWTAAPILSRKSACSDEALGLRVVALRKALPDEQRRHHQLELVRAGLPVLASWDAIKTHLDERLEAINLQRQQAEQQGAAPQDDGDYQRPYLAFSRVGQARTMVPSNLQAPLQQYLSDLQERVGNIDEWVGAQLGMGLKTLAKRFSPEQVDGVAIMLSRLMVGRSSILADDTGIGKGRQLAALAVWANKRGLNVYFVTDRANLFSDLARDLHDIGEWGRFAPLVFNADGEVTVDQGAGLPPRVLAKGESSQALASIFAQGKKLADVGRNLCFLTYSQINQEESEKALWLKNVVGDGLVIFDEAHIAAGSDSNIARHVAEIAAAARHVQFASATWAKTPENLHIYQRALPSSMAVATLAQTMRKGGESFGEIFSAMLASEGALIRREHDLSQLEVEIVVDKQRAERNEHVSDSVAEVLGAAAYVAGEMEQIFIRSNAEAVRALRQAREALGQVSGAVAGPRARLFSTNFGTGSVIYQVMKAVQGTLNAEHVAQLALQSYRQGNKPVIVTDATGESLLDKLLPAQQDEPQRLRMPTLRDVLRDVLWRRLRSVRQREMGVEDLPQEGDDEDLAELAVARDVSRDERAGGDGQEAEAVDVAQALQQARGAEEAPQQQARRQSNRWVEVDLLESGLLQGPLREVYERGLQEIEAAIEKVPDLPVNAIDVMAHMLRSHGLRVGEITGRKMALVRPPEEPLALEGWQALPRSTKKSAVKASIRAFNDGALDVLIINRAAAAGISLHASPRFGDRSRRHLIEHMIPEDPVNRIQLLGRVNRFDQVSAPLITTASTGIYGEVRYLMMQNRKLARMSANVRSSRDNAMSLKGVVDLLNPVGAHAVRTYLYDHPLVARRLGFDVQALDKIEDIVNRVTMRIPLLRISEQKQVYDEIHSRFDEILLREEMDGRNPLRPAELQAQVRSVEREIFVGDDTPGVSAFDAPVWLQRLQWQETLRPLSWSSVVMAVEQARDQMQRQGLLQPLAALAPAQPSQQPQPEAASEAMLAEDISVQDLATQQGLALPVAQQVERMSPVQLSADLVRDVVQGCDKLVRLALMTSGHEDVFQAAQANNAVRRAMVVAHWMRENLSRLVPGAGVHWLLQDNDLEALMRPEYFITSVQPPEERQRLLDFGAWRLTVVLPGSERARIFSLRSLLSEVDGVVMRGEISGTTRVALKGPALNDGVSGMRAQRLALQFDGAPKGLRQRSVAMLTGNLYLASEWAAATGKGRAVVYTDENGMRQRGILLPQDLDGVRAQWLPVRLADPQAQTLFLHWLLDERRRQADLGEALTPAQDQRGVLQRQVHVLDLSFKSAMARARSGPNSESTLLVVAAGEGLALSMSPQDLKRIAAALRAAQKSMDARAQQGHEVPGGAQSQVEIVHYGSVRRGVPSVFAHAVAGLRVDDGMDMGLGGRSSRRGQRSAALLVIKARTPQQIERALHLLSAHAGLEIYAAQAPYRGLAQQALRSAMQQRRQRQLHEQLALQAPAQAAHGADPDAAAEEARAEEAEAQSLPMM